MANQRVGIAQETAKRKTAELAVTNAGIAISLLRIYLEGRSGQMGARSKQQLKEDYSQVSVY